MSGKIAGTQMLLQQKAGWRMVPSFHIVVTGWMVPSSWYCRNRLVQTWASLPPGISSLTDVIQNIFSTWLLAMALPSTSDFCASQSTLWTDCCLRKLFLTYCTAVLVPRTLFVLSKISQKSRVVQFNDSMKLNLVDFNLCSGNQLTGQIVESMDMSVRLMTGGIWGNGATCPSVLPIVRPSPCLTGQASRLQRTGHCLVHAYQDPSTLFGTALEISPVRWITLCFLGWLNRTPLGWPFHNLLCKWNL